MMTTYEDSAAAAATHHESLILALGRLLADLWDQRHELDEVNVSNPAAAALAKLGAPSKVWLELWDRTLTDATEAAEVLILSLPPRDLREVAVQLMVAHAHVNLVENGNDAVAAAAARRVERATKAAWRMIADDLPGGLDLREYGGRAYGVGTPGPYYEGQQFELAS